MDFSYLRRPFTSTQYASGGFGLALVLFVFLLAAAAAFARSDWGKGREISIQYSILIVLIDVGLLMCSLSYLQEVWRGPYRRSLQWLAIIISIVFLGQQIIIGKFGVREANQYRILGHALSPVIGPRMPYYVYWDRDEARAGSAYLRAMQIPHGE